MKRILLFTVALVSVCVIQAAEKPNVLFIISDDLAAGALSSYGNAVCQTPNIDRLASEGVRYTRTYCQFPVCGPSGKGVGPPNSSFSCNAF
jgi:iduronate 2-sulfatase